MYFKDRSEAGEKLAEIVAHSPDRAGWKVVGLARGGVIVGAPIARRLGLPLVPLSVDDGPKNHGGTLITSLDSSANKHVQRLKERNTLYNSGKPCSYGDRVLLCDDGLFTGKTMFAAIKALRANGVRELSLAIPVVPPWLAQENPKLQIWTWRTSKSTHFKTGMYYFNFEDTPDEEVVAAISSCPHC